jgi:hypothetical protein
MIPLSAPTMLSLKTTIAALSVIATASVASALIPQAFAQALDDNDDEGNTVTAFQSNSQELNVSQSQSQVGAAEAGTNDDDDTAATGTNGNKDNGGTAIVAQDASQGFCLQTNQQNAAAGNDASNSAGNTDTGSVSNSFGSVGKDCS